MPSLPSDPQPDPLFAAAPDRRGTGSEKWDRWAGRDVIPTWVADMDFAAPEVVLDAIRARVPEIDAHSRAEFARRSVLYWLVTTGAGFSLVISAALGLVVGIVVTAVDIRRPTHIGGKLIHFIESVFGFHNFTNK